MKTNTVFIVTLALLLALSACGPAANTPASSGEVSVTVDVSGLAQNVTSTNVAAVLPGTDVPAVGVSPAHTELSLEGYPIGKSKNSPQIFVYAVKDLSIAAGPEKAAKDLQSLLQTQQTAEKMPYLPFDSEVQMLHAQVKFLDFKNGKGVRYLTEWSSGLIPVNNRGLLYTYQGLTSDGKYYVAVVLPVNLPSLPADEQSPSSVPITAGSDYVKYLADTATMFDQQPVSAFTPDLSKLDALVQSIEVK